MHIEGYVYDLTLGVKYYRDVIGLGSDIFTKDYC